MSIKTKKKFKNIGKVVAGVLFALLLFTNIKVALLEDNEIVRGDISVLGIEVTIFEDTYANKHGEFCAVFRCYTSGDAWCAYGTGPNGQFQCWKPRPIFT